MRRGNRRVTSESGVIMKAIDFVLRSPVGAAQGGVLEADVAAVSVEIPAGSEISLNLRQFELAGYARAGADLQITLADGRIVTLKGYFSGGGKDARLFISADGYLSEVALVEG